MVRLLQFTLAFRKYQQRQGVSYRKQILPLSIETA